ncbi:S-adenosyl-L-methionine-dependent methyltransferase [Violaceomyces palustris]|uniref:S-adenosyl-L-methionine-dependent methyltransferase n=1 Tax=Violaceomyces palustris TaxID=1673888 RepID=A0ACD0NUM2_9BASI|nr:S-adenosyl-L-methionine-dependent methyltransferase [Violaceomyces palustris]
MSLSLPSIPTSLLSPLSRPLIHVSRSSILSLFSRLTVGELEIRTKDGNFRFGDPTLVKSKERNHRTPAAENGINGSKAHVNGNGVKKGGSAFAGAVPVNPLDAPRALLIVNSDNFWVRMFLGADLGFAESYMSGEVDTPDLGACFNLFIQNRESLSNLQGFSFASSVFSSAQTLLNKRYANTKIGSLKNIGAHYDISNAMYQAFLSKDMTYSCAVYEELDADVTGPLLSSVRQEQRSENPDAATSNGHTNSASSGAFDNLRFNDPPVEGLATEPEDELEAAQLRKLRLIIKRANIRKGDRVLEIGTGWGSFAMEAVRMTGCKVDSLTLSVEQKALAEERIALAGLSGSITVHLMDYRDLPEKWNDKFDRLVSIEMLEAVGIEFLETYFRSVDRVLKRKGGAAVFQCITMPESRFESYLNSVDFIRKWIFPGGVLPSVTSLVEGATKGSEGRLVLDTAVSIGPHYSRTLREWRQRFEDNFDQIIAPALVRDHEEISKLDAEGQKREIEVFRKKWIYYFVYCEVGFTQRVIGDHILAFTREGNTTLPVCCG